MPNASHFRMVACTLRIAPGSSGTNSSPGTARVEHAALCMRSPKARTSGLDHRARDGLGSRGHAVSLHHSVVVQPQERDHVADVVVAFDLPRADAGLAGEHRVVDDAALLVDLRPDLVREDEVRRAVAVQMTELVAADREAERAPVAVCRLHSGPRGGLFRDLPARRGFPRHLRLLSREPSKPTAGPGPTRMGNWTSVSGRR